MDGERRNLIRSSDVGNNRSTGNQWGTQQGEASSSGDIWRNTSKGGDKGNKGPKGENNHLKNAQQALGLWRVLDNPQIQWPSFDIQTYFPSVARLAQRGKRFLTEVSEIQVFKKTKSAMRSYVRLQGGKGHGAERRVMGDSGPMRIGVKISNARERATCRDWFEYS